MLLTGLVSASSPWSSATSSSSPSPKTTCYNSSCDIIWPFSKMYISFTQTLFTLRFSLCGVVSFNFIENKQQTRSNKRWLKKYNSTWRVCLLSVDGGGDASVGESSLRRGEIRAGWIAREGSNTVLRVLDSGMGDIAEGIWVSWMEAMGWW